MATEEPSTMADDRDVETVKLTAQGFLKFSAWPFGLP